MLGKPEHGPWSGELKLLRLSGASAAGACDAVFRPGWFTLVLVLSGELELAGGGTVLRVATGQLCGMAGRVCAAAVSPSFRGLAVSCTMAVAINSRMRAHGMGYLEALAGRPEALALSKAEVRHLEQVIRTLQRKMAGSRRHAFNEEMVLVCLNLLLYEYAALYHERSKAEAGPGGRIESIALGFIGLLEGNVREQHETEFYAATLCITSGHLRRAVRRVTGKSPRYFIDMALLSEAFMLLSEGELTVSEIGELLNFGTLSSFSAFFKRCTRLSPSEYRTALRRGYF